MGCEEEEEEAEEEARQAWRCLEGLARRAHAAGDTIATTQAVLRELSPSIGALVPPALQAVVDGRGQSVPYLTVGDGADADMGSRRVVHRGTSALSGDFVVEEVDVLAGRLGILGMRERAASVGAKMSIRSDLGEGTRLDVEMSLREGPGREDGRLREEADDG